MRNLKFFIVFILLLSLTNCKKDAEVKPKDYPYVITYSPNITYEGAEFSADLTNIGNQKILKYGFVWSKNSNPTIQENSKLFDGEPKKGIYSYKIHSGLTKGQTYYVRAYILTYKYEVYGNVKSFKSEGSLPPEIVSFSPSKGYANTKITIKGINFGNNINGITVKFGDVVAKIDSITDTFINVRSPLIKKDSALNISVEVAGMTITSEEKYIVFFSWKRMADYPGVGNHSASYFSLNGKGFMIGGTEYNSNEVTGGPITQNVWEFDPTNNSWAKKNDLPFDAIKSPTCVVNNVGYIYDGDNNIFYKYIENTDSWAYETSFPGQSRSFSCFVIGNEIYAGIGNNRDPYSGGFNEFFKYNVNTKEWKEIATFPGKPRNGALSFSLNGKGYIALGKIIIIYGYANYYYTDVWEYNLETDKWIQKNDFPGDKRGMALSFVLQSKAYIGMGAVEEESYQGFPDFWEYKQDTDEWIKKDSYIGGGTWNNIVFAIGEKAYVGTGAKSYGNGSSWGICRSYKDLWEFDPNKK